MKGRNQFTVDEGNDTRQRRVLADILTCKVCQQPRRYNAAIGFSCGNYLHEWQSNVRTKKLAAKLGSGGKRRL